uniref:Uncharacterized protein n=1 Tax=Romanomermis culicivorax TaxID=13658 RepID=A0A915IPE6_ROMCU
METKRRTRLNDTQFIANANNREIQIRNCDNKKITDSENVRMFAYAPKELKAQNFLGAAPSHTILMLTAFICIERKRIPFEYVCIIAHQVGMKAQKSDWYSKV